MSRILKDVYENDTFTSVFYRLIIVCPRWCFWVRSQSNGAKPKQELPVGFQNKIRLDWLATIPKISQILLNEQYCMRHHAALAVLKTVLFFGPKLD